MALSVGDLRVYYSGGPGTSSMATSLGGSISTSTVRSQDVTALSTLASAVTVLDAHNNNVGSGTMLYDKSSGMLFWRPPGGVDYSGRTISSDGIYTIGNSSGYLIVNVTAANLPAVTTQNVVTVSYAVGQAWDNVSASQCLLGLVEYRGFFIKNTSASDTAFDVRICIKTQPISGIDTMQVALNPAGLNQPMLVLADEKDSTNVLAGITFSEPSTYANGLVMGNLAPSSYYGFWQKRIVPADTRTQFPNNRCDIEIGAQFG